MSFWKHVSVPWSGFINRKASAAVIAERQNQVSVPWSGFINRKVKVMRFKFNIEEFQSRGRDLLIGKNYGSRKLVGIYPVSVPWSGFINRKEAPTKNHLLMGRVSVPWSGFINRKALVK